MKQTTMMLMILALTSLLLVSCQPKPAQVPTGQEVVPEPDFPQEINEVPEEVQEVDAMQETDKNHIDCENDLTCTSGDRCIDGTCKSLTSLFETDGCKETCKVSGIKIITSDKENYELKPGEGSYTTAGALQWKIIPTPAYCKGSDVIVPVEIEKRSTGVSLGKQVITLQKGIESDVITHPTISRVQFTATATEITETCN